MCYRLLQVRDANADDDAVSGGRVVRVVVPGNSRACRVAVSNRLLPRAIMFGVSSRTQRHVAETHTHTHTHTHIKVEQVEKMHRHVEKVFRWLLLL